MKWDYAELAKKAKEYGGPKELLDNISKCNRAKGRLDMVPVIIISNVFSVILTIEVPKIYSCIKRKLERLQSESEKAEAELIKNIEKYNDKHNEMTSDESDDIDTSENQL